MPTRNIVLTAEQEAFISRLVKKGRYQNASEVLRHGLRLVEDEIQRRDIMLGNLRQQLNAGLEQFEAGDLASGTVDEIFSKALLKAKKNSKKRSQFDLPIKPLLRSKQYCFGQSIILVPHKQKNIKLDCCSESNLSPMVNRRQVFLWHNFFPVKSACLR